MKMINVTQINDIALINPHLEMFGEIYTDIKLNLDAFVAVSVDYLSYYPERYKLELLKTWKLYTGHILPSGGMISERPEVIYIKYEEDLVDYFYNEAVIIGSENVNLGDGYSVGKLEKVNHYILDENSIISYGKNFIWTKINYFKINGLLKEIF